MRLFSQGTSLILTCLALLGLSPKAEGQIGIQPVSKNTGTNLVAQTLIPTIPIHKLPAEAQATIALIKKGGPFPYKQDGSIFRNREKRLPFTPMGYYREYTVPTPGSLGRGARRIVTGQRSEIYYSGDHYRSFMRVQ